MDLTLPLFAAISARLEAGQSRHAVLASEGVGEEVWLLEQRRWLDEIGRQVAARRFQLLQWYLSLLNHERKQLQLAGKAAQNETVSSVQRLGAPGGDLVRVPSSYESSSAPLPSSGNSLEESASSRGRGAVPSPLFGERPGGGPSSSELPRAAFGLTGTTAYVPNQPSSPRAPQSWVQETPRAQPALAQPATAQSTPSRAYLSGPDLVPGVGPGLAPPPMVAPPSSIPDYGAPGYEAARGYGAPSVYGAPDTPAAPAQRGAIFGSAAPVAPQHNAVPQPAPASSGEVAYFSSQRAEAGSPVPSPAPLSHSVAPFSFGAVQDRTAYPPTNAAPSGASGYFTSASTNPSATAGPSTPNAPTNAPPSGGYSASQQPAPPAQGQAFFTSTPFTANAVAPVPSSLVPSTAPPAQSNPPYGGGGYSGSGGGYGAQSPSNPQGTHPPVQQPPPPAQGQAFFTSTPFTANAVAPVPSSLVPSTAPPAQSNPSYGGGGYGGGGYGGGGYGAHSPSIPQPAPPPPQQPASPAQGQAFFTSTPFTANAIAPVPSAASMGQSTSGYGPSASPAPGYPPGQDPRGEPPAPSPGQAFFTSTPFTSNPISPVPAPTGPAATRSSAPATAAPSQQGYPAHQQVAPSPQGQAFFSSPAAARPQSWAEENAPPPSAFFVAPRAAPVARLTLEQYAYLYSELARSPNPYEVLMRFGLDLSSKGQEDLAWQQEFALMPAAHARFQQLYYAYCAVPR